MRERSCDALASIRPSRDEEEEREMARCKDIVYSVVVVTPVVGSILVVESLLVVPMGTVKARTILVGRVLKERILAQHVLMDIVLVKAVLRKKRDPSRRMNPNPTAVKTGGGVADVFVVDGEENGWMGGGYC